MQSMFPQLFCSVGLGFHTLDLMSGKQKGQCLLQASEKREQFFSDFLCWVTDSKLQSCRPQHFLLISTAILPRNLLPYSCLDFWTSVCPHFGLHLQPNKRFAFC